jgi:hypothetical protein
MAKGLVELIEIDVADLGQRRVGVRRMGCGKSECSRGLDRIRGLKDIWYTIDLRRISDLETVSFAVHLLVPPVIV